MSTTPLGPGEGETLPVGPASQVVVKADAAATGGTLFVGEVTAEPGFAGPPPHVHDRLHDMFYVLEGTLTVLLDGVEHAAGAGTFAVAAPGVVHTFRNDSDAPARFLNFNTPGGFEAYIRELAVAAADGPIPPARMGEIASKYDVRVV